MIKKILIVSTIVGFLSANMVNGIAMLVNNSPITLYDIDKTVAQYSIPNNEAVGLLIDEKLYNGEVKKYNIKVSKDEVNAYVDRLAQSNNMNTFDFKQAVQQRQPFNAFLQDIKKRLISKQLIEKIGIQKIQIATKEDVKLYYENNINEFKTDKNGIAVMPLEQVKEAIFNKIMLQREKQFLKEHFEALRITADIKIIR